MEHVQKTLDVVESDEMRFFLKDIGLKKHRTYNDLCMLLIRPGYPANIIFICTIKYSVESDYR